MKDIFQELKATAKGKPALPAEIPDAIDLFARGDGPGVEELFQAADLVAVYRYLRGGVHLRIPPESEWKPLFPVVPGPASDTEPKVSKGLKRSRS